MSTYRHIAPYSQHTLLAPRSLPHQLQAVLLLDVDFVVSSSLQDSLSDPLHRAVLKELLRQEPVALVLPAFETAGRREADADLGVQVLSW